MPPQITVLDAGGQYCHLIARRVRQPGRLRRSRAQRNARVRSSPAAKASSSPADQPAFTIPAARPSIPLYSAPGTPILGICYGQQLMAHLLGGRVEKGEARRIWIRVICKIDSNIDGAGTCWRSEPRQQVWMSHFDTVVAPPAGFDVLASTETCSIAAIADPARKLFAVQFHPEVGAYAVRAVDSKELRVRHLRLRADWDPAGQILRSRITFASDRARPQGLLLR